MHPVLNDGRLCWCISGHRFVFMVFLCSIIYISKGSSSEILLGTYSGPKLNETLQGSVLRYADKSSPSIVDNDTLSCEDLNGAGTFETTCILNTSLQLDRDLCISGAGNLEIYPNVMILCHISGCSITVNVSGNVTHHVIHDAIVNSTSLGGPPPAQTSGTPSSLDGAGGGHGGRGASCLRSNSTPWGGDVYSWSTLSDPWSFGSKGGSASADRQYGGDGGGRIMLKVVDTLNIDGFVLAEGGEGGLRGGVAPVVAFKKGKGTISAAGGRGWGGGGGGRISLDCYSIQGVKSLLMSSKLKISNDNFTTQTGTPLLDFPTSFLWSNVFVEDNAQVLVPLLWTRVQVRGQIRLLNGGSISFGLSDFPVSEFELVAEELLMSDSVIKVFGAFRMYVKMLLMWESKIQIDGGGNSDVGTSLLEARNLIELRKNSAILSNADLGIYGQGLLKLSGHGVAIKGQRLFLSLFYNITMEPGTLLQAPSDDGIGNIPGTQSLCDRQTCPKELILPPDDCQVNSSLSFTLQICRVEDLTVSGTVRGSILHIHRARTVIIKSDGLISAAALGGVGEGKFLRYGAGGGAGHGGKGGSGFYNRTLVEGGRSYGDANLPCELGSGSGGSNEVPTHVAGGWPLSRLEIHGALTADGTLMGGLGGGSGGTILLFLRTFVLGKHSSLSITGGKGGPLGGGGGGGGRIHFDWSNIATDDEYVQIATVNGIINASGGAGSNGGYDGEEGTITGKACPKGLYGTFCNECPVGTYKDVVGSDPSLCNPCQINFHPHRAHFIYVRGGATQPSCPYRCFSEKYKMPKCYTPLEELIYTFGGPCPFSLVILFSLLVLALVLSVLRTKFIGADFTYQTDSSIRAHGPHTFPYLLSLAEVPDTSWAEETQNHVHRLYFMGPNKFREPWHLPYSPPDAIIKIVYEDAFNRFIDEINSVAAYEWWEGSVHRILAVLAYPCAWSWKQWRRRKKIHALQEYVRSEYDHSCLRSCRSRALYKGMKVGSTPDLMVAFIDFFLGGDEKREDVAASIQQRFPLCVIFGGNGNFMSPYYMHDDTLLRNLIGQYVPAPIWSRFIAGLNAQLRTLRQTNIHSGLNLLLAWISSHANPRLDCHGVKIELGWFQGTASGYYQLGILVSVNDSFILHMHHQVLGATSPERPRRGSSSPHKSLVRLQQNNPPISQTGSRRRTTGGVNGTIISEATLRSLQCKRDYLFPFSLLLQNTRPIGIDETLQLLICGMLLGDIVVTLLMLLQFYWIYLWTFLAVLLILPLSLISTFPAGLNALFSRGPKRSTLARIYALWNASSLSNVAVAYFSGIILYGFSPSEAPSEAGLLNCHVANLEIDDRSLLSGDPDAFWGPAAACCCCCCPQHTLLNRHPLGLTTTRFYT
ncbi:unnamed protein product [Spirodela intermedia]|uniref:DUF8003 domain-containing protein n=1 Tax=Spirodela intermedia TaxID=51605 RepID=A0A7I8JA81_SPIIN|nr:unnamed protein product [Spirodela intermedia]CAA6666999.1 unnamed protein product [Spirodela intermedia]